MKYTIWCMKKPDVQLRKPEYVIQIMVSSGASLERERERDINYTWNANGSAQTTKYKHFLPYV